jgi:dihydroxyacetone kinase
MLTVKLSKNEKTGSAFIKIYEGDLMVLGLDVRADNSMEVHDWNGFAGDHIHAIHSVITDIINGEHRE